MIAQYQWDFFSALCKNFSTHSCSNLSMQPHLAMHWETVIEGSDHFHKVRIATVGKDFALNHRCWSCSWFVLWMFAPSLGLWWSVLLTILGSRGRTKKKQNWAPKLFPPDITTYREIVCINKGTRHKIFCEFAQGFPKYWCLRDSV